MSFILIDQWQASHQYLWAALRAPVESKFAMIMRDRGWDRSAPRLLSALLAMAITGSTLTAMAIWFGVTNDGTIRHDRFDALQLIEPTSSVGVRRKPAAASAGGGAPVPAPAAVVPSVIDTSTPTPLSIFKWSVSRIPAPLPLVRRTGPGVGSARGSGVGVGNGPGGDGVYDPYAGASPARRDPDGPVIAPNGVDHQALAEFTAEIRRMWPAAHGELRCMTRVAITGIILEAACTGNAANAQTVARLMIGRRLYDAASAARAAVIVLTV